MMGHLFLAEICETCNLYNLEPKKAIKIYNKIMQKNYIGSQSDGLDLLRRYVRMNYDERVYYKNEFKVNVIYDIGIQKTRR